MKPSHAAALRVECSTCHQLPGNGCRNYRGKGCAPHAARLAAGAETEAPPTAPVPCRTPTREEQLAFVTEFPEYATRRRVQ